MKTEMPADLSRRVEEFETACHDHEAAFNTYGFNDDRTGKAMFRKAQKKRSMLAAIAEIVEENARLKSRASIIGARWDV